MDPSLLDRDNDREVTAMASRGRILVIDNEPDILEVVSIYFDEGGYEVITAPDGTEGLALAEQHHPDVVLLDIRMPGLSGLDVLSLMRMRWPRLPVIMLTAVVDVELAKGTLRRGSFDYVRKPFDLHHLHRRVAAALARHSAQAS